MSETLLEVRGLATHFATSEGKVPAVDGVDFRVGKSETLGIVGESGCGKSVTSLSIMRLVSYPGEIVSGEVLFEGEDLLKKPEAAMCDIRGNRISMIFQEPMTSLNPVRRIGDQVAEPIALHRKLGRRAAKARAIEMLDLVGIPSPTSRFRAYPHELSGGMRQRVMIAMAMSCDPRLLIADEPTTALDVTIQVQILDLMRKLQAEFGSAILLITHDLGVVAEMAKKVLVMYAGRAVELADVGTVFARPRHPYTRGLLDSIPKLAGERKRLSVIQGAVPNPMRLPLGCRFAPRCPRRLAICERREPPECRFGEDSVRCWLYSDAGRE